MTIAAAKAKIKDQKTVIDNLHIKYRDGYKDLEKINSMQQKENARLTSENEKLKQKNAALESENKTEEKAVETVKKQADIIRNLKKELAKANKALDKARDSAAVLRKQIKKNSSTSDKPQSGNIFKKPFSTREKSDKKQGGQKGHKGHTLNPFSNPTEVIDRIPFENCLNCGDKVIRKEETRSKQLVGIKMIVTVTEEVEHTGVCESCGKIHRGGFSEKFVNPVNYDDSISTLVTLLNTHTNVAVNKITELFDILTDSKICMSGGTVVNMVNDFSVKSSGTIESIKKHILESFLIGVDETGCRVNGKLDWMQIFANDMFTLFSHNKKRGDLRFEEEDLIEMFTGILLHDHFKSYYRYEHLDHSECNDHIDRAVKAVAEILKHPWANKFRNLLNNTWNRKKELLANDSYFGEDEIAEIINEYNSIIDGGFDEYEEAIAGKSNIRYFNDERCLLKRLKEFSAEHLRFVTNADVPCGNNVAERAAKEIKRKVKVSGGFRSDKGADNYARAASVVSTLKKQKLNIFDSIKGVFQGIIPEFSQSATHPPGNPASL